MMETEVLKWISDLGFPAAAFLLMYRMVTVTISQHTAAIGTMTTALTELRDAMKTVRNCPLAGDEGYVITKKNAPSAPS
jgi:hypothetical protein